MTRPRGRLSISVHRFLSEYHYFRTRNLKKRVYTAIPSRRVHSFFIIILRALLDYRATIHCVTRNCFGFTYERCASDRGDQAGASPSSAQPDTADGVQKRRLVNPKICILSSFPDATPRPVSARRWMNEWIHGWIEC